MHPDISFEGVGFGGYLGSSRVESSNSSEEAAIPPDVDGEMAQHLKRLGRKDPTTKVKALTSLNVLFKQVSGEELVQIVPKWAFEYRKLLYDYSREVRRATHEAMANLVTTIGFDFILSYVHSLFISKRWMNS
ncbi:hypothetical protein Taro_050506 [Colocasia esculenta]|uniref:E3 ubiquitin-protein ligase listerin n=1 Tax=Colocasia esculenta TaxID=4460 RepID=A0A843XDL6_COLES|nr:hypothetical protein [Colocasia esculenta]